MKTLRVWTFCLLLPLVLTFAGCSKSHPDNPYDGRPYDGIVADCFPGELKIDLSSLDTITPPINPLHPLSPGVDSLPAYYGYLNCARFANNKRYCALIGLSNAHNVYFLTDNKWELFRYDSPIVAGCYVGELLYIRGYITTTTAENGNYYYLLQVADIQKTDSIITPEPYN